MKAITLIPILALGLLLSGCKTQQSTVGLNYDDVYAQPSDQNPAHVKITTTPEQVTPSNQANSTNPPSAVSGNDYSEYSYSDRIKKFHSGDTNSEYYDSTYAGNYVGGGSSPDVDLSFSLGFGVGAGYYGFGYGYDPWYWSYGYPYYSYGWSPYYYYPWAWYNPWGYPYYWPYYSYDYYCGYWNGYYDGYYGYPHNEYPYDTYYYGRRDFPTSGSAGTPGRTTIENQAITENRVVPSEPSTQQKYQYTRPSNERQTPVVRQSPQNTQVQRQNGTTPAGRQSVQPGPKYSRETANPQVERNTNTQPYSSPAYRQSKSSQQYVNPRTTPDNTIRQQSTPARQPNYSRPAEQQRNVSPPQRQTPKSYSTPSRSSSSYENKSSSSRSSSGYSSPSRSNSSYSAPSRSSGSGSSPSSSPSRSSGGGGGSSSPRSGGGGGFGGRR